MTDLTFQLPSEIESLVARVVLCAFEDDPERSFAVLTGCVKLPGKASAVIALLGSQLATMPIDAVGEDNARRALENVVADVMGES